MRNNGLHEWPDHFRSCPDSQLLIRVSRDEAKGFKRASDIAGESFSAWARKILRTAAIRELKEIGEDAPFMPKPIKGDKL